MFKHTYISKFLSAFLLVIFVLGITPKQFLHNAFATHIDKKPVSDKPYQLSKSGYNCNNNDLVVEPVFLNDQQIVTFPIFSSFSSYLAKNIFFASAPVIFSQLRGPPVNS